MPKIVGPASGKAGGAVSVSVSDVRGALSAHVEIGGQSIPFQVLGEGAERRIVFDVPAWAVGKVAYVSVSDGRDRPNGVAIAISK